MFNVAGAQSIKDSAFGFSYIHFGYTFQVPDGDMAERFGPNSAINTGFSYKTRHNFIFGVEGSYMFGRELKEKGILDSINTSTGLLINANGELIAPRLSERGYTVTTSIGKIFPHSATNKNSGVKLEIAVGFIQHKIRIEDPGNNSSQVYKEYRKGYDRLTNGLYLQGFAGYQYFSKNKYINVIGGFSYGVGYTQNRRTFNFDTMEADTRKRKDILWGPKVALIIPFYSRAPEPFYYH
jgi:hypothetical protein